MSPKRKALMVFLAATMLLEQPLWLLAQPTPAPNRPDGVTPGLVIVVEGIGGLDHVGKSADASFKITGLPHEVRHFHWTHGTGKYLRDLQDTQHILKKADELAAFIRDYRARHPNRPVYIVAKSGGTGLVLFALQVLPANCVERVILLSAAVAPTYDLRPALRATRREVVSFYSHNDRYVLGWGTSHFGTVDRYYGKGAGLTGFVVPQTLSEQDRQLYARLVQVPFSMRMLREGVSTGTHHSTSSQPFVTAEVVPWLR